MERWSFFMSAEVTLQQIAESVTKSVLNANDKDLEGFQRLMDETIKVRESHRNLQRLLKSYSSSVIQRS